MTERGETLERERRLLRAAIGRKVIAEQETAKRRRERATKQATR